MPQNSDRIHLHQQHYIILLPLLRQLMLPTRYNRENISRVLQNPQLLLKEFRRIVSNIIYPINNKIFTMNYGEGIDIMNEDWDNLIILDACRYDYFEDECDIQGELSEKLSQGSYSFEFMEGNFINQKLHDTVYVTSNPHSPKLSKDIFHDMRFILDSYTSPQKVIDEALNAYEDYPEKRLIVHLMPPHRPHLGPTADSIQNEYNLKDWNNVDKREKPTTETSGRSIWNLAIHNEISTETLRKSYRENLNIGLEYAKQLNDNIDGKTVITSDHGELLGERAAPLTHRRYGHPHEVNCRTLRIVPWFEIESQNRRKAIAEPPVEQDDIDNDMVDDRLTALGYKPN